jgi:hypothetical protein
MAFTSYSDLKTTIANYLARSDLSSVIPDFIRLSEERLRRELRIRQMLVVATTTTAGGNSKIGLPSDFLEMRDIHLNTTPVFTLRYKAPNSFYETARVTDSGRPVDYTILGTDIQLAPVPDTAYTVQMLYYAKPALLSDTNTSNVFLANCPDALLYGALAEAEPYLMNDNRIQVWASLYDRSVNGISTSDQAGEYSGQPMSMSYNVR